jgi:hypothetical protein
LRFVSVVLTLATHARTLEVKVAVRIVVLLLLLLLLSAVIGGAGAVGGGAGGLFFVLLIVGVGVGRPRADSSVRARAEMIGLGGGAYVLYTCRRQERPRHAF